MTRKRAQDTPFRCYVVQMPKRKLAAADPLLEQFQTLRQIKTLSHAQCREVMTLLNRGEEQTGGRAATREKHVYPFASGAIRQVPLQDEDRSVSLHMFSLPEITQKKIDACLFFRECFESALATTGTSLELLVYWDEAVPGNILAPDLRRKAAMTYVCFPDFPVLWTDTSWMTLSVCRSQDLQNMSEGFTRSISMILEEIRKETNDGFMIDLGTRAVLVHLRQIAILADADGLRLLTGSKGAAGLKPCFKCRNIVSGGHLHLRHHEHISSVRLEKWESHTRTSLRNISQYLSEMEGKTAKEKAETHLGWNVNALRSSAILNPNLDSILSFDRIYFDPMHCFISNGIACQELGLWYTELLQKSNVTLGRLRAYAKSCWQPCVPNVHQMDKLFATKLWVMERDFRGDASETLLVMPLCVAFSHEIVLPLFPDLRNEVESLSALYAVLLSWLRAKYGNAVVEATRMEELQKKHVALFVSTYGPENVRPKLHFSLHLPQQFRKQQKAVDAFPGERKHIYFKQNVAPRCKALSHFAKSVLMELGEMDFKTIETEKSLSTQLLNPVQLATPVSQPFGSGKWQMSKKMLHAGRCHGQGQYKLLPHGAALKILGALQKETDFFLLCQEMTCRQKITTGFSCWNYPDTNPKMSLLPMNMLEKCEEAVLKRVGHKDAQTDICLLLG